MSIFKRKKNENGAIAVMAAFVITALVCITALAIDFGLYYYNSAKLQNAVDAAATAVAANLDSTDLSQEQIAKSYLKKNGFDVDGEYADSFHITIDKKGILDEETLNPDAYITTGYIKLTVDVDENALFANILNLKSLHLRKTAFVKCEANYTAMPRALKYSLFAGTSGGTQASPAMVIRGRTGNVTDYIVSEFEGLINGINANIVQPIIGIFGGTPNLNDLVHINLSEVITNGDVHSNSNIKISAQAINASRVKDQDYDGTESNDDAFESISKTDDNEYDDYGQVTYTSVGPIQFSNSNINTGNDSATHVYVQNQQYLEQTQNVLTVLNKMNLSTISSTAELQNKYEEKAHEYLNNMGGITESQKTAIINQKDNMTYDDSTKTISLDNQSMLVYDVSQLTANSMLAKAQEQTLSGVVQEIENNGIDPLYSEQLNEDGSKKLLFQNYADKKDNNGIDYGIQIVHKDDEGNSLPTVNVDVKGTLVRRDLGNAGLGANDTNSATASAAKFAVARTFQQNLGEDGYITVPNMKPYFVRQVNKSIRNSTKTKEELGDSEALGSRTVKEAVAKMSSNLGDTLNKISYNDDTYRGDNFNSLITKNTTPFFTRYKSGKDDSLTDLTGDDRTTFNGVKLYDTNNELRTASDNVKDFAKNNINKLAKDNVEEFEKNNITPDENGESNYGKGAVKKYFDNNIANNDAATKDKYATVYGKDAVQKKRDDLNGKYSSLFETKKAKVDATDVNEYYLPTLPDRNSVFLGPDMSDFGSLGIGDKTAYTIREQFNSQMNYSASDFPTYTDNGNNTITVTMPNGSAWADGATGSKTFSKMSSRPKPNLDNGRYYTGFTHDGANYLKLAGGGSYVNIGDITVKKDFWGNGGGINVGESGPNATLVVYGKITTATELQVRNNCTLFVIGNIDCNSLYVEEGGKIYCTGKISVSGSNSNNINIKGSLMSLGDIYINPRVYLNGTIKCKGNLTLNGDKDWNSLDSWGKIYVTGNLYSNYTMYLQNSEMYVCGNVEGANNSNNDSDAYNIFHITGADKVYIGGYVGTNSSKERHIWIEGSGGATFSVYGFVKTGSITYDRYPFKNLREFCNNQSNSKIYIGDGRLTDSILNTTVTISFPNTFQNYGTLYCYDQLQLTGSAKMILSGAGSSFFDKPVSVSGGDTTVSGGHTLYCADSASMANLIVSNSSRAVFKNSVSSSGTISASGSSRIYCPFSLTASALNINNNSRIVCKSSLIVNSINVSGNSKVWGYDIVESGDININSDSVDSPSEVYCGAGSRIRSGAKLIINGYFCTPSQSLDGQPIYNLNTLEIGSFGKFICYEDVTVSNNLSVNAGANSEHGVLYVEGKTTFTGATVNNADKMYLMGGLNFSGNSATACGFNLNSSSDTFIGTNTAGGIGTITLTGYYYGQGNMYIENNLVVNGYNKDASGYVPNRYEGIILDSGNTYVSGNINVVNNSRALYTAAGTSLSCKNLSIGSSIYNIGKLYIYENLDFRNSGEFSDKKETDSTNLKKGFSIRNGGKDGVKEAVIYIGGTSNITIGGSFQNFGKYYQNGGMSIQGYYSVSNGSNTVDFAMINQDNAESYFAGNVYLNSNAFLNATDTVFSCDGDFMYGISIYNCGKFAVTGYVTNYETDESGNKMTVNTPSYNDGSFAIRNGVDYNGAYKNTNAVFYCGGTKGIKVGGCLQNFGKVYCKGNLDVRGFYKADNIDFAMINQDYAQSYFAGNVYLNSNALLNCTDTVFSCDGNLMYGVCAYNCGKMTVLGDITNDEKGNTVNNSDYKDKNNFAFRNGCDYNGGYINQNAFLYCKGEMHIGTTESAGLGGSVQNWASMYVGKNLIVYSNEGNSRKANAVIAQESTKTFIGGNIFSSGGTAIMCNSIFMVDGNYLSKRSTKINIDDDFTDNDQYSSCYVYVGGNMLVNTMGLGLRDHPNSSRDFDIYSNSNIYVGGNVYANCRVYIKQNVTFIIKGDGTLKDHKDEILNHLKKGPRAALKPILEDKDYDYTFFISQCLDENICSRLYVNGHMFVRDTAKMRDMVKNYVYGDFKCTDYVELGKSLDDDNRDATQASDARYRDPSDSNVEYRFKNAGYMYIDGNYYSQYYNKIYASTTLRVKGEYETNGYLTLRHDAKIFVGKRLRSGKSIDGGSYSQFYVAGTMKAQSSFIKLRDCTTVVVGGNMTAYSYIELGKAGDYTRVIKDKDNDIIEEATGFVEEGSEPDYGGEDGDKTEGSTGTGGTDTGAGPEESIKDTETLETAEELASDTSDKAKGGVFYVGKTLASYTSYIKEFAYSSVAVGEYVFTPKYVTLRHNADMWVMPEAFNNQTFVEKQYVHSSDGTLLGDIIDKLKEIGFKIQQTFTPKNGSIYTLGQLTLNKNASLMGTYDCIILGKCVLRQDSLVYMGHNFECSADSIASSLTMDVIKGNEAPVGFDTYGTASASGVTFPVVVYANNEINIVTTMDMKLTYLVANKGDVKLYNVYSKSENAERNAKQLPNAVASYQGDIDYFAMYGKIGALFYAPNGKLDLDGWYSEIWGCGLGDTVDVSAYYFAMHRFTNWRTMDLQIAESGNVYLVSEKEYENAVDNIDDIYMFTPGSSDMSDGAGLFFDLNN